MALEDMVRGGGGVKWDYALMWGFEGREEDRVTGGIGGSKKIDAVLARIFMDALKREGVGPARALQALNAEQYYRRVPYFVYRKYSTLSFFKENVLPVRMHGLSVVSVALGVHYLVVGLALAVLIVRRRREGRCEVMQDIACVGEESYHDKEEDAFDEEKAGARQ
jgi:hypothetical protein